MSLNLWMHELQLFSFLDSHRLYLIPVLN